ncbi:hypothetical protein B5X24_HaOG203728 [Helicoverpa armigera]|uniref:Gustatory receptor n=1 Tax=Helicoverpa armigera TaxID=29058 RepID=A0A2W1BS08_HELAM|nr:hypothetical protein B5X24_HaOG203728 [Helicoverpa armigera]
MQTRRATAVKDLEDKLRATLKELETTKNLCAQLLQEREDSEVEVKNVVDKNTVLKNDLAELHIQHMDLLDQHNHLQQALVVTIVSASWLIKDIVLVIFHSVQCEMFYIAIEEAEISCVKLMMNKNCPGDQARLYKKVMQTNRTFSKMSACGLFYVDGVLPLKLTGLLASYVIVLLQFAFL